MLLQEHIDEAKEEGCVGCKSVCVDGIHPDREGGRGDDRRIINLHIPGAAAGPVR